MRMFLTAMALALVSALPASAQVTVRPQSDGLTLPPHRHPYWPPYYPYPYPYPRPPYYPYPTPRPPQVRLGYSVYYRTSAYAGWQIYGRYASNYQAQAAAAQLRARGFQTDVVVTY